MAIRANDPKLGLNTPEAVRLTLVPPLHPEVEAPGSLEELLSEVSDAGNSVLDDYRARLLKEAHAEGDTETLINILVVSSMAGISREAEYTPGRWGCITDGPVLPHKGFPNGVRSSLGGGIFAVETQSRGWEGSTYLETLEERFVVIPAERSRRIFCAGKWWPEGMVVLPGEYDLNDPGTVVLSTSAQGPTRLKHQTDGDVVLGQVCADAAETRRLLNLAKDVCWAIEQKYSHE